MKFEFYHLLEIMYLHYLDPSVIPSMEMKEMNDYLDTQMFEQRNLFLAVPNSKNYRHLLETTMAHIVVFNFRYKKVYTDFLHYDSSSPPA